MTATVVTTPDWTSTRYFALKGDRRNAVTGEWMGDLVNHPATAFYTEGANLVVLDTDRQVVIWADPQAAHVLCRCEARKPLVSLMLMWEGRGQRFDKVAHLDGTACEASTAYGCTARSYCTECGEHDTLTTAMEAWGNRTTCTTPGCTLDLYYSIGD